MTHKDVVDYFAGFKRLQSVSVKEDITKPGEVLITIEAWFPILKYEIAEFVQSMKPVQIKVVVVNKWVVWSKLVWCWEFDF